MAFDPVSYTLGFISPFVFFLIFAAIMRIVEKDDSSFERSILKAFRRN